MLIDETPEKLPDHFLKNNFHPNYFGVCVYKEAQYDDNKWKHMTSFINFQYFIDTGESYGSSIL